ncbi:unnamed protein product [Closterium sp. NIES-64]|nr:unnamed protein product [Closterium sp. NIES-64]
MADESTSLELASIDKLELLNGTTAVNWVSFEESLFTYLGSVRVGDYCLLDVVLETPNGLPPTPPPLPGPSPPDAPPLPTEPTPQAPILGAWEDDPDRWARTLNKYNKERDDYVIKSRAHAAAIAGHEAAAAKLAEFKAAFEEYYAKLRKHHSDLAAWRIANRRALTIIFSCVPSSLKRDLRPPSSPSLWKSLSSQYDRQDLRSLLSLFRTFQDITLDTSLNAASFARRLTDTAHLRQTFCVNLPPSMPFMRAKEQTPAEAAGADQDVARAVVEEEAVAEVDEEGALGNVAGVGQPLQPRSNTSSPHPPPPQHLPPSPHPPSHLKPLPPYPPLSPYPPPYAGWPYPLYPPSLYGHGTAATAAPAELPTSPSHPPGFTPPLTPDPLRNRSALLTAPPRSRAAALPCLRLDLQRSCLASSPPPLPPPLSPLLYEDTHDELLFLHLLAPSIAPIVRTMAGTPLLLFSDTPTIFEPTTYEEAIACLDAPLWI